MNGYKKSILLIILFYFTISCKLSENKETEPNNTFSNANKIEIGRDISGYLDHENDTDNFLLNIDEEQVLRIELSGIKGINHAIYIYKNDNPKPQLIKVIDDNRKSAAENFANLYVQQGQYFISISHGSRDIKKANTETPYKILITARPYISEEKEPDDTPYSGTEIFDKTILNGYFSPGQNSLNMDPKNKMKELDWYKFNITIPDNTPALVDLSITGVPGVDSIITILNSGLDEIITVDNSGTGEGEKLIDFGIKESGTYYAQISSKNFLFNNDIPYELRLEFKTYGLNSEFEPNNSFEKTNKITDNFVNGKINGSADKDFYQFVPQNDNRYYRIKCSGADGLDIIMTVYDYNKNRLFEINNAGAGGSEIVAPFAIKNPIFISISASSLLSAEAQYTLEIEKFNSDNALEMEPNNSKNTANPFIKKISGFINYKNDIDYYLVKQEDRKKYKITVKGIKEGKIRISTTDPLGFIIKSKDIGSDEEISFSEIFDKKGFIIVEPLIPNYEFPYTITFEEL